MRYAVVEAGVVTNVVVSDEDFAATQGWVLIDGVEPSPTFGWRLAEDGWAPPDADYRAPTEAAETGDMATALPALAALVAEAQDVDSLRDAILEWVASLQPSATRGTR